MALAYIFKGTFGSSGSGNGQFSFPGSVAIDSTRIYVADDGNNRVQVFDRTALSFIGQIAGLNDPLSVTVGGSYIYIYSYGDGKLKKYNKADLSFVSEINLIGHQGEIPIYHDGVYLFASALNSPPLGNTPPLTGIPALTYFSLSGNIAVDLKVLTSGVGSAIDIFVDANYIYKTNASVVSIFSKSQFEAGSASAPPPPYEIIWPLYQIPTTAASSAWSDGSYIYVSENSLNRIDVYELTVSGPSASPIHTFCSVGVLAGEFNHVNFVRGDGDLIVVSDKNNHRVQLFEKADLTDPTIPSNFTVTSGKTAGGCCADCSEDAMLLSWGE